VTNTMQVGCNNVGGQALVSMVDGSILTRFLLIHYDDVVPGATATMAGIVRATMRANVFHHTRIRAHTYHVSNSGASTSLLHLLPISVGHYDPRPTP